MGARKKVQPKAGDSSPAQNTKAPDPLEIAKEFLNLGEQVQKSLQLYASPEKMFEMSLNPLASPFRVAEVFTIAAKNLTEDPTPFIKANEKYAEKYLDLWEKTLKRLNEQIDTETEKPVDVFAPDRRFRDPAWEQYPLFNFMKQSYLLWDHWVKDVSTNIKGLDPKTAQKVSFYSRQITDAFSPGNYLWSNPKAIKKLIESGGQSLMKGLENYLKDLEEGGGTPEDQHGRA